MKGETEPWIENGIGVSLPELELIQYIFDEGRPTNFRFPHITTKFPPQK